MGFIDSYKKLEKQCNERYNANHGVTIYIQEMIDHPNGSNFISNWNNDLKNLKHCRYIRNKIVHEPNCSEENMCSQQDTRFLADFNKRMANKNDPLSIYFKNIKSKKIKASIIIEILIIIVLLLLFFSMKYI